MAQLVLVTLFVVLILFAPSLSQPLLDSLLIYLFGGNTQVYPQYPDVYNEQLYRMYPVENFQQPGFFGQVPYQGFPNIQQPGIFGQAPYQGFPNIQQPGFFGRIPYQGYLGYQTPVFPRNGPIAEGLDGLTEGSQDELLDQLPSVGMEDDISGVEQQKGLLGPVVRPIVSTLDRLVSGLDDALSNALNANSQRNNLMNPAYLHGCYGEFCGEAYVADNTADINGNSIQERSNATGNVTIETKPNFEYRTLFELNPEVV